VFWCQFGKDRPVLREVYKGSAAEVIDVAPQDNRFAFSSPTSWQTCRAMSGLSPVSTLTVIPLALSARNAGAALSFGGIDKGHEPGKGQVALDSGHWPRGCISL